MAGKDDLSMEMLQLGDFELPKEVEKVEEEKKEEITTTNVADDESQEIVGDGTEESLKGESTGEEKSPANSDDNVFKSLASFLTDKGLLSVQPEELENIKDDDAFAELMKKQIKANEYSDLNDNQKKYLEAMHDGIPEQVFHEHLQAANAFEQLTDEIIQNNPEVRRDLIVEGVMAQGFDKTYALKQYQRVSGSGDVAEEIDEAILMRNKLKQSRDEVYQQVVEDTKEKERVQKEEKNKEIESLKTSVYAQKTLFDVLPVSKGVQDKVYSLMTKPVAYTNEGYPINALLKNQIDNPVEFQTSLYYLYELTNGFKDLKKLVAKAGTQAVNTFKSKLEKSNFINTSSNNLSSQVPDDMPNIIDISD